MREGRKGRAGMVKDGQIGRKSFAFFTYLACPCVKSLKSSEKSSQYLNTECVSSHY